MNLTREQRAAIFAGNCPSITGEGESPVAGLTIRLSSKVSLTVNKVKRNGEGKWWINYTIHDKRDPVRNLRRTPADAPDYDAIREAYAPENFKWDELPVVAERNNGDPAEQSAYTTRRIGLVAEAGEAPHADFMASVANGAYEARRVKREAALAKAHQAARELREAAEQSGATGRERKHIKEIEHHLGQLKTLGEAA